MNRIKTREKEQKEAEDKAKEILDAAEKLSIVVTDQDKTSCNGLNNLNGAPLVDGPGSLDNYGNPFEEMNEDRPQSRISRKKSIETMDASTTTEDFRGRGKLSFNVNEELARFKLLAVTAWKFVKTKPRKWLEGKPLNQRYIYTNTEEALDYIDDYAKFCFPMGFMFMMLIYWTCYLYVIQDKLEMDTF